MISGRFSPPDTEEGDQGTLHSPEDIINIRDEVRSSQNLPPFPGEGFARQHLEEGQQFGSVSEILDEVFDAQRWDSLCQHMVYPIYKHFLLNSFLFVCGKRRILLATFHEIAENRHHI